MTIQSTAWRMAMRSSPAVVMDGGIERLNGHKIENFRLGTSYWRPENTESHPQWICGWMKGGEETTPWNRRITRRFPGMVKRAARFAGVGPLPRPRPNRHDHYFINTIFIVWVKLPAVSRYR